MLEKFAHELDELKRELLLFSGLAMEMIEDSITALRDLDAGLARDVNSRKRKLAAWSNELEEKSLRIVALYQPVAADIRMIVCINQMNYSMFRIGRMGKDIAKLVEELANESTVGSRKSVLHMADLAIEMVRDALKAYETGDLSYISEFDEKDDVVDDMRTAIFRENLTYIMEDQNNIRHYIANIIISRHLERCGDHACLMAGKIHFMLTGDRIEIR